MIVPLLFEDMSCDEYGGPRRGTKLESFYCLRCINIALRYVLDSGKCMYSCVPSVNIFRNIFLFQNE